MNSNFPGWSRRLTERHLKGKYSRPAVKWLNHFAWVGIAVGVFAWTSVMSLMEGLQNETRSKILREKPHLLWESGPTAGLSDKLEALRTHPNLPKEIKSIEGLLQSEGILELPDRSERGRVLGSGVVLQGRPGLKNGEIQLGVELLSFLLPRKGEKIALRSAWKPDSSPLIFEADQSFETGIFEIDRSWIRLSKTQLEDWLGVPGSLSRIEIQIQNPHQVEAVEQKMEALLGLPLKNWKELDSALWYSLRLEKIMMGLVVCFVLVIALLALFMAIHVRVVDKRVEIGILRALGASDKNLSLLFVGQGLCMGALGSFVGLIGGWLFCQGVSNYWQQPAIYYSTRIPFDWNWSLNLALCGVATLWAGLVSWLPARKIQNLSIADTLRS